MSKNIIKRTPAKDVKQVSSDYVLKRVGNRSIEAYALKNGSKGIRAIPHTNDERVPVRVTVAGHPKLNGWYPRTFLKNLNLI